MSSFEVKVYSLEILPHPNADRLELSKIGDYLSIIPKGVYKNGDLAVYIPEQAIVPEEVLAEIGMVRKLAGKQKNRVKAAKFRGVVSQGLILPTREHWKEGDIVNDELKIIKYEPVIPEQLAGEVDNVGLEYTIKYDIENFKRFPDVIEEGEMVQFTEKLHGTFSMFTAAPSDQLNDKLIDQRFSASSKGLGKKGLAFKDNEKNKCNTYLQTAKALNLFEIAGKLADRHGANVTLAGEIFGSSIQDLKYGLQKGTQFRLFDIAVGNSREEKRFLNHEDIELICKEFNLQSVPILYVGAFSKELLLKYTYGKETVSGTESHIREGLVVKPLVERYVPALGRVLLKSISDDYLLRKNGTEFT
jgi:RNA ligase (TIGR02306 family)